LGSITPGGACSRGFNVVSEPDRHLFETVVRGEHTIAGFRNAEIRKHLPGKFAGQVSRMRKRLWTHQLIKKIGRTYKYYITDLGRTAITMGLKL
jgi:hypothetical protein